MIQHELSLSQPSSTSPVTIQGSREGKGWARADLGAEPDDPSSIFCVQCGAMGPPKDESFLSLLWAQKPAGRQAGSQLLNITSPARPCEVLSLICCSFENLIPIRKH